MKALEHYVLGVLAKPASKWETTVAIPSRPRTLALVLAVLANGLATVPAATVRELQSFAADPFSPLLHRAFEGETPLFFFLAHGIGAVTVPRYLALCVCLVFAAYMLIYLCAKISPSPPAFLCVLLFASHPIATILQTWLGMVDCLTVAATAVLLFSRSLIVIAVMSLVMVLNHTAAPLIALPLLILRMLAGDSGIRLKHVGVATIALLAGRVLLMTFHAGQLATRFGQMRGMRWTHWANINITNFPLIVYSMAFVLWIPLVLMIALFFNENRRLYGSYLLFLAVFYAITVVTMDTTRVYALLSWAPTLYCLMYTWRRASDATQRGTAFRVSVVASVLFGWFAPRLFVWDGKVYAPWLAQPIKLLWEALQA